jgi:hypothetical protein
MKPINQQNVLNLVHQIEAILVDGEAEYSDAMAATIYVAAVAANNMGMTEKVFLANCKILFEHDKKEQLKEMQ